MIASIFVLFVAAGITVAAFVYGFGGVFPLLAVLTTIALILQCASLVKRGEKDEAA